MKKVFCILFLMSVLINQLSAQEVLSVHARHKLEFGNQPVQKSMYDETGKGIIPLRYDKSKLSANVFGYLPYWEYSGSKNYLQYDLLTHIALFDFSVNSYGAFTNPSYWPWTDVINNAHSNGVKAIMCITNFELSGTQFHSLLTTESSKQAFFTNIKNTIQQYNLDGVNIDFEAVPSADRGTIINGFMTDLTTFIHTNLPGKEVSYAGPIINWGGWDLAGLAKACDYIFIMGYDFYGSWSATSGPSAPLGGGTYNVTSGITSSNFGYGAALSSYSDKLILGVPYFGNKWTTKADAGYDDTIKYVSSVTYKNEYLNSLTYGVKWDSKSQTPWYSYKQDKGFVEVWYENDSSLGLKYDLAKAKKLKGVGMWALGQDGSRPEYWNLLRKRYLVDVKNNEIPVPSSFNLSQNYPNPFNPSTVINYEIPVNSKVSLKVFDLLGRQVAVLVDEEKTAGSYSVEFNTNLSSGVYFYVLKAGSFSQVKKMTVLK